MLCSYISGLKSTLVFLWCLEPTLCFWWQKWLGLCKGDSCSDLILMASSFFSLSLSFSHSFSFFWSSELTTLTLSCFVPTSPNLVRLRGFGPPLHTHRSSHRVHFGIPKLSTSLPYKSREQSPAQRCFPHGGRERHILVFSSQTDAKCYSSCAADAVWQHWHFSSDRRSVPF